MLIEAVATLVIIALLIGLVLPLLPSRTTPHRMLALVSASASLLRDARTLAVRSNRPVGARFDTARRRLVSSTTALTIPTDVGFSLKGQQCRDGAEADILFWPDGTACGGTLRFSQGRRILRARVNGADGHVDIVQGG